MSKIEKHEFQAEVKQILDLVVRSLYSNKDIFLRELVSNACDALDRRRFEAITNSDFEPEGDYEVTIQREPGDRILTVLDNGIGMSRREVVENLGTIAHSGSKEFLAALAQQGQTTPDLIGEFGVGFYASFMVADRVEVVTRRLGEDTGTLWRSSGDAEFIVEDAERAGPGTTIRLHLKAVDEQNGLKDYMTEWTIREIIKRYSDFVSYPIRMEIESTDSKKKNQIETLNSMKAIWTRPKNEVTDEEYREFYKHIAHDWTDPLSHISVKLEGAVEARALLFIPSKAPLDLYYQEMSYRGIQLYVRQVFIMDECKDLMPRHLRFIKGVVDSEDLSLNVSREMLQQNRQISAVRKFLVRKIFDELRRLKQHESEKYQRFWREFGAVLKEGLVGWDDKKETILDLMLCTSSTSAGEFTGIEDYVNRMKDGQDIIYYITGPDQETLANSPHIEKFVDQGHEVLFLSDRVDEMWLQQPPEYKGKKWKSVGVDDVEIGENQKQEKKDLQKKTAKLKNLLSTLQGHLSDQVKDVRLSSRMTDSPACLVSDSDELSPQLAAMLREMGQDVPRIKRILELNPDHPIVVSLQEKFEQDKNAPEIEEYALLLHGQALLAEGAELPNPTDFGTRVAQLMEKALKDSSNSRQAETP